MTIVLKGVYSALATPFTHDATEVDDASLRDLVERMIAADIDGLVPCGSTGEFAFLERREREHVVETTIEQAAGRVPVVPQTGAMTTAEAVSLSRHAEAAGAAAVMVVAPYYEPLSIAEVLRYYRDVADSISIPIMAYNLPVATGVNLGLDELTSLVDDVPNVRYVKDTSGDFTAAARLIHNLGDRIGVFVGWDTLFLAALFEGAAGSVIGAANVVPKELVAIHRAVRLGDHAGARAIWEKLFPVAECLVSGAYTAAVKTGMELGGWPAGPLRAPQSAVSESQRDELRARLAALG